MADLADVEEVLVATAVRALYPLGTDEPSAVGQLCRVYRGWPQPAVLNADLQAGTVNVTVVPDSDVGERRTRYRLSWHDAAAAVTMHAVVADGSVSFEGIPAAGQLAGVLVDGVTHVYRVREGDTVAVVAATLAAMIRSSRPVALSGATLSVPGANRLIARVVANGVRHSEVRRQARDMRIICWCPSVASRDAVSRVLDQVMAGIDFLPLPDGSAARLIYKGTTIYDQAQNALLYRRDLVYSAEYPTIATETLPAMLFGHLTLNAAEFSA